MRAEGRSWLACSALTPQPAAGRSPPRPRYRRRPSAVRAPGELLSCAVSGMGIELGIWRVGNGKLGIELMGWV